MPRRRMLRVLAGVAVLASLLTGCWPQARFGPEQTGANPTETHLSVANVHDLTLRFTLVGLPPSEPVVVGSRLYADSLVFDATGQGSSCGGTPRTCLALSRNSNGGPVAVDGAHEYVGLSVFDATATCPFGGFLPCLPLWSYSAKTTFDARAGVVANGHVYVPFDRSEPRGGGTHYVAAYDAGGTNGCSNPPVVCGELFEYPVPAFPAFAPISGVAVAGNRLFVGAGGYLAAYDATGTTNCTQAVPRICNPRWALTAPDAPATAGPPVVSGNTLFVRGLTTVVAFDVATGARRWETGASVTVATGPAVAGGMLYVGGSDGRLLAFDANGVGGCSGTPKTCAPLWRSGTGAAPSSPSVANGVVYTGAADGSVRAFDAAGTVGCSGTPKTCTPLFSSVLGSGAGAPLVANGRLYVPQADGNIAAFATSN